MNFASCPNKELATPVPDLRDKATPVLWAVRVPISFSRAAASRPGPGARQSPHGRASGSFNFGNSEL